MEHVLTFTSFAVNETDRQDPSLLPVQLAHLLAEPMLGEGARRGNLKYKIAFVNTVISARKIYNLLIIF